MLSNDLRLWQQANRFRIEDDAVYGVYKGVGFSVVNEDDGKLFVFMLSGGDDAYTAVEDRLAGLGGQIAQAQVGDVENYLAVFFDESEDIINHQSMTGLLEFIAENYRALGFRTPNKCVKCGESASKRSFYKSMVQPMCQECSEQVKLEKQSMIAAPAQREAADRQESRREPDRYQPEDDYRETGVRMPGNDGYYSDDSDGYEEPWRNERAAAAGAGSEPAGFLGAVLGAVAGLTPFFISAMLGLVMGFLCIAVGIGAVVGYISFGGVRDKKKLITTAMAVSVVLSLLVVIIACEAQNMQYGFGIMMKDLFTNSSFIVNIILNLLSVPVGVLACLDSINSFVTGKKIASRKRQ